MVVAVAFPAAATGGNGMAGSAGEPKLCTHFLGNAHTCWAKQTSWAKPFFGEIVAVTLASISLASEGFELGRTAALLSAAALCVYIPIAILTGKMPFAVPTEYEKRRAYAQKTLGVRIPRSNDKTMGGWALGTMQVNLPDDSDESIRVAVGRAYCLGDKELEILCSHSWIQDMKVKLLTAKYELIRPITLSGVAISAPPELLQS